MTIKIEELTIQQSKIKAIEELSIILEYLMHFFNTLKKELNPDIKDETLIALGGLLCYISDLLGNEKLLIETVKKIMIKN